MAIIWGLVLPLLLTALASVSNLVIRLTLYITDDGDDYIYGDNVLITNFHNCSILI